LPVIKIASPPITALKNEAEEPRRHFYSEKQQAASTPYIGWPRKSKPQSFVDIFVKY